MNGHQKHKRKRNPKHPYHRNYFTFKLDKTQPSHSLVELLKDTGTLPFPICTRFRYRQQLETDAEEPEGDQGPVRFVYEDPDFEYTPRVPPCITPLFEDKLEDVLIQQIRYDSMALDSDEEFLNAFHSCQDQHLCTSRKALCK